MNERKPKLNVKLLRQVKKHILEEPKRLYMGTWTIDVSEDPENERPACGMQGCIGGWVVLLSTRSEKRRKALARGTIEINYAKVAKKRLGLTEAEASLMFGRWTKINGIDGAREVARKIDAIIEDRDQFVRTF